jgi:hypothetical protein
MSVFVKVIVAKSSKYSGFIGESFQLVPCCSSMRKIWMEIACLDKLFLGNSITVCKLLVKQRYADSYATH